MMGVAAILHANKLFKQYKDGILRNTHEYLQDYLFAKVKVDASPAQYRGEPIRFLYQPMFFTDDDIKELEGLSKGLVRILTKVIQEYRINPDFRRAFNFPSFTEELILCDPGYGLDFPVARFDLFYSTTEKTKFCELNTDGTSSMHESTVLHQIFSDSKALNMFSADHSFYDFEVMDSWISCLLQNYSNFSGRKSPFPNIAIADFEGDGTMSEFIEFQKRISALGYQVVICDPREFEYKDGILYHKNLRIDLIYRRAVTARLIEEASSISDLLNAYKDGNVCVVGGLVSQLVHNKILFAILHDQSHRNFLSPEDKAFIDDHIPYTLLLEDKNAHSVDFALQNKDFCILKPCDLYAASGVYVGKDTPNSEWIELVKEKTNQNYIIQEFCKLPQIDMMMTDGSSVNFELFNCMIGLFMYNQKFRGIYTRVGRQNIIAEKGESFTLPNFILK